MSGRGGRLEEQGDRQSELPNHSDPLRVRKSGSCQGVSNALVGCGIQRRPVIRAQDPMQLGVGKQGGWVTQPGLKDRIVVVLDAPGLTPLLQNVGGLMGQQSVPFRSTGPKVLAANPDAPSNGRRLGPPLLDHARSCRIGMNAHPRQALARLLLQGSGDRLGQRHARRRGQSGSPSPLRSAGCSTQPPRIAGPPRHGIRPLLQPAP